ncbi:MAG: extracellular solute-binding protein [Pseudomonadota bacterium]
MFRLIKDRSVCRFIYFCFIFCVTLQVGFIAAKSIADKSISVGEVIVEQAIARADAQTSVLPSHGISRFDSLKYPADFKHFDYVNPEAPKGGQVRYAAIGTFDNLNPHILKGITVQGISLTSNSLMVNSQDELFSSYGLIAESIFVSENNDFVEFTINPLAKWHDGTKMTPEDVIFSFDKIMSDGHPFYRSYYQDVEKVVKSGEGKVKFIFSNNKNSELPIIVGQFPIISKAYYSKNDFSKTSLEPPLANGPYKIKEVKVGQYIIYERVKDYWAKDLPVNKGLYNFDEIRYDYYRDMMVASEAFKAGNYDIHLENTAKTWANSYNNLSAIEDGSLIKRIIQHQIPTGMQSFVFNLRREKFQDVKVRKALNYIFDFNWINKTMFFDSYRRTTSFFSNSVFASSGLPSDAELELLNPLKEYLPAELFEQEFQLPITDGSGYNRKNLRVANQLLNEAGIEVIDKKRYLPNGELFEIEFLIASPAFERVIAPMIQNLEKLGIAAKIRFVDAAQYENRLKNFNFDICVNVFGQSNSPGNEQINYWHSSKADISGSKNYIGIQNKAVDNLIEHIISATSNEKLITSVKALDRVLLWNWYVIPNWYLGYFRILHYNKFGYPENPPPYALDFNSWWKTSAE